MARLLQPRAVDLAGRDHLPEVPRLAEEDVPARFLVVHREIEVAEVEVGMVGVVAGEVELELAAELPAVLRLGSVEVEAEDRVVHAEHRLVVAVLAAVAARQDPVGVDVGHRLVRVVDGLERQVAVGRDLEPGFGERLEDAGRDVGEVVLPAHVRGEDAAGFAALRRRIPLQGRRLGDLLLRRFRDFSLGLRDVVLRLLADVGLDLREVAVIEGLNLLHLLAILLLRRGRRPVLRLQLGDPRGLRPVRRLQLGQALGQGRHLSGRRLQRRLQPGHALDERRDVRRTDRIHRCRGGHLLPEARCENSGTHHRQELAVHLILLILILRFPKHARRERPAPFPFQAYYLFYTKAVAPVNPPTAGKNGV